MKAAALFVISMLAVQGDTPPPGLKVEPVEAQCNETHCTLTVEQAHSIIRFQRVMLAYIKQLQMENARLKKQAGEHNT